MAQCDARIKDPNVVCIEWKRCPNPAVWQGPGVSYDYSACDDHLKEMQFEMPKSKFERIK